MKNPENKISEFEKQCLDWFNDDSIGRNQELFDFISYLKGCDDDVASIFLDSDWGQGKTVFIKQAEMLIRYKNPQLEDPDYPIENVDKIPKTTLFPVYYNAWENDTFDDPLASILASISLQAKVKFKKKLHISTSTILANSIDLTLAAVGFSPIANSVKESLNWDDYLSAYDRFQNLKSNISDYLDKVQEKTGARIVLFIDELDRCKPSYTLKLLETIKNKFVNKNFLVVYSVNTNELSNTVQKFYGNNIDGHSYLQKFYDKKIFLNEIDADKYIDLFSIGRTKLHVSHTVAIELSNYLHLSLRQRHNYFLQIEEIDKIELLTAASGSFVDLLKYVLLPLLIAIKISNPASYKKIKDSCDIVLISEILDNCENLFSAFKDLLKNMYPNSDECPDKEWFIIRIKEIFYYLFKPTSTIKWNSIYNEFSKHYVDITLGLRNQVLRFL